MCGLQLATMAEALKLSEISDRELGGDYFDRQRPEATAKRLTYRFEKMGYRAISQKPEPVANGASA